MNMSRRPVVMSEPPEELSDVEVAGRAGPASLGASSQAHSGVRGRAGGNPRQAFDEPKAQPFFAISLSGVTAQDPPLLLAQ